MSDSISSYIRADEKLLWRGQPQQGLRLGGHDLIAVPFSLLWGGGVLMMLVSGGISSAGGFPFVLFPLLFGFIALYVTVGRLLHDAWIRSRMEYALTDRRIIVFQRGLGGDVTTVDISKMDQVRFQPRGERGDIVFGRSPGLLGFFGAQSFRSSMALWVPSLSETPQFLGVEDARRVYDQIEGLRVAR
ncbi:hypothetical protein [Brevundimonas sp.]|uniref:hypothetical protein n=1 Tax=Brevundimonas sp. TaxID=1871086 RepID=UPI0028AD0A3D|nr:hypothetical protein [Brevundimonas sp.]